MIATLVERADEIVERFAALDGRFLLPGPRAPARKPRASLAGLAQRPRRGVSGAPGRVPGDRRRLCRRRGAEHVPARPRGGELAKVVLARKDRRLERRDCGGGALGRLALRRPLGGALVATLWALGVAPGLPAPRRWTCRPRGRRCSGGRDGRDRAPPDASARSSPPRSRRRLHPPHAAPLRAERGGSPARRGDAASGCHARPRSVRNRADGSAPPRSCSSPAAVRRGPGSGRRGERSRCSSPTPSTAPCPSARRSPFSIGMQAGVAIVNTVVGMTALMLMFRAVAPTAAVRSALATVRRA